MEAKALAELNLPSLTVFFGNHHDKMLCTANRQGEPSIAIMGTPRITVDGTLEFEISDEVSTTLDNIEENKAVAVMVYTPGPRARDFTGARVYAEVTEIQKHGEKVEAIRNKIKEKHGEEKAAELVATVTCRITRVRPLVDRGQPWDKPPFGEV